MPFFSIVMPVLNRAHLVAKTIASLTAQRFDDFEILLADGGSTDGTPEVAERASNKVRIIAQPKDRPGIGAARSVAFEQADSEYIACLDSDDFMFPWGLSTYKAAIDKYNKPAFMLADGFMFHNDAELKANIEGAPKFRHFEDYFAFLREPRRGWSLASGSIFRTEHARAIAGQSDKIVYAEDSDMFLRLGDKPGFVRIEGPLTFGYHQHDQNVSINFDRFLRGMHQLIAEEEAGGYPGGDARAKERRNELTTLLRSAARRCLNRRRLGDGWELYRKTVKWNAQVGKWAFVAGYPAMMALTPLRRKKRKSKLNGSVHSTGQMSREEQVEAEEAATQS